MAVAHRAAADHVPPSRGAVGLILVAFVLLPATNYVTVAIMNLYVTETQGLSVI